MALPKSKIKLPINGSDVMKELGIPQGSMIGKLMKFVEEAYLDNPHLTRQEALDIIKKEYRSIT